MSTPGTGTVDAVSVAPPAPEDGNSTFLNLVMISRFVLESKKGFASAAYFAFTV